MLACVRGQRVLLGPLASWVLRDPGAYAGLFDAVHTHTVTSADLGTGSRVAAPYERLAADRGSCDGLIGQLRWRPVAEVELYRGCTRRRFCSFCNEPVKSNHVKFRDPADVLDEITVLYEAGVRNVRLGQQTCFFSYLNRDAGAIEHLLAGIREGCPDLEVLHIDNADPLAVASRTGAAIARLVARYCTEGNCAPMGIESFDPAVIEANALTCTPQVQMRAIANVNEAGAQAGPSGLPVLLPGLNLIYGLPGKLTAVTMRTWPGWCGSSMRDTCVTASTSGRPAPTRALLLRRWVSSSHRRRLRISRPGRPTSPTCSTIR